MRSKVTVGQQLIIPRAPTLLLAANTDNPPPAVEARSASVQAETATTPVVEPAAETKLTYRVKRGDTLFSIAKLYRTTVASLKSWNRLRSNSIKVGQRLTIFVDRPVATN